MRRRPLRTICLALLALTWAAAVALLIASAVTRAGGANDARSLSPRIEGGTARQAALLAQIVQRVGPSEIRRITIRNLDPRRAPLHRRLAALRFFAPDTTLTAWQAALVAGTFDERAQRIGLPAIASYSDPGEWVRVEGPDHLSPRAPGLTNSEMQHALDRFRRAVRREGGELLELRLLHPDRYALSATIRTREPARFVRFGLSAAAAALGSSSSQAYDGWYIRVTDPSGRVAREAWQVDAGGVSADAGEP